MTHEHIDCEQVLEQLFAYLDGELETGRHELIAHHLEACRGCFSRAEFERRLRERLVETGDAKAPETLARRVRTLIEDF